MHLTNALITSLALAGSSAAYFSIPLGNIGAPPTVAPPAAQPASVAWCPFGSLFQPSRCRVVWPFPLILATNNGPAPAGLPIPAVACPASCVAQAVTATVTVTSPPVTTTTTTTATTTTTLSGPLPTEVADGYANCAGGSPPKPNPLFDDQGNWACCVGSFSSGSGVGCT
ncbi:hypothetical protein V495_05886 [Pseudogymnoascus sp. VKM F-4514 (FW-929)]|nr:hypothetical protein V495_05886 [Pseudogymnoascus sp. VKM F-4514 (FW-929)]KFY56076.1 hypothetical protein V497_06525 [Pseudogymnoascus sp. VKM F-4516 (FW-969)]